MSDMVLGYVTDPQKRPTASLQALLELLPVSVLALTVHHAREPSRTQCVQRDMVRVWKAALVG